MKILCKLFGHKYRIYHRWHVLPKRQIYKIVAICERCGDKIEIPDDESTQYYINKKEMLKEQVEIFNLIKKLEIDKNNKNNFYNLVKKTSDFCKKYLK